MREVTFRIDVQGRDELLEAIDRHGVVARCDVNIFTACLTDARIPAAGRALAWSLPGPQPRLACRRLADVLPRAVIGIAVVDEQLPVLKRLFADRLESFRKEGSSIQVRYADRDLWVHRRGGCAGLPGARCGVASGPERVTDHAAGPASPSVTRTLSSKRSIFVVLRELSSNTTVADVESA